MTPPEPTVQRIGRFELRGELGQGGFGIVYRARDPALDRDVALKLLGAVGGEEVDLVARFEREAQAAARLNHRGIVTVYELGHHLDRPYIVMELLEGEDLSRRMRDPASLTIERKLDIVRQLAEALAHAHSRGVVHRDLKPSNVRLLPDGTVKVADFGVALLPLSTLTRAGRVFGTPAYMAPEQLQGQKVDGRADLYSLGVVFYEMLAGRRPFVEHSDHALALRVLRDDPPPLEAIRSTPLAWLEPLVMRLLEKDPGRRFPSAAAFLAGLGKRSRSPDDAPTVELVRPAGAYRAASADEPPRLAGRILDGRYRVLDQLGEGGMSRVYLASDERMGRQVAIKVPRARLLADPDFRERFAREVRNLTALVHPFVVQVYDTGWCDELPFLVLQYLSGGTLAERRETVADQAFLGWLLGWTAEVAEAIDFLHSEGYVHRDVKPSNLLFDRRGHAHLADFGLVRALRGDDPLRFATGSTPTGVTPIGVAVGTPGYLAPESATEGEPGPASDQYSLAVVAYELVSGHLPHSAPTLLGLMVEKSTRPPRPLDPVAVRVPPAFVAALMRALATDPVLRFPSCGDFVRSLQGSVKPEEAVRSRPPAPGRPAPSPGTRPAPVVVFLPPLPAGAIRPEAGQLWVEPRPEHSGRRDLAALVLEAGPRALLQGEPPIASIVVSSNPSFDDMLASTFLRARLEGRELPAAAAAFASYAALVREGLEPGEMPLTVSIEGVFLALRAAGGDLAGAAGAERFLAAWARMEAVLVEAMAKGLDPFRQPLFDQGPEFARERTFLAKDHLVYRGDVARGECWRVMLGDRAGPASGLFLRSPRSLLFKNWSRRDETAPVGGAYEFLAVAFGPGSWVFSTDPVRRLSIRELGERLQEREAAIDAARAAADPWFQGAPFGHTLVAAPRGGTRIPDDEVLAIVKAYARAAPAS